MVLHRVILVYSQQSLVVEWGNGGPGVEDGDVAVSVLVSAQESGDCGLWYGDGKRVVAVVMSEEW